MDTSAVSGLMESMIPMLTTYGLRILGVIVLLWVSLKIAGWAGSKVTSGLKGRKFDETLSVFFGSLIRWMIILGAGLACLSVFGIETTSFAAIIGAAGLAIGLAFQGTLSNFAAGVMLLVFRPFKVGDLVEVSGFLGTIREIGLFTTSMDTFGDNRRVIIPNTVVTSGVIDNYNHNPKRRVDIPVGVDYSADIDATRAVLEKAALAVNGRDAELGHQIIVTSFGASSVDWQVRVWCNTDDYWTVYEDIIKQTKNALDDAGIGIPFPQLDLHFQNALKMSGNAPKA